MNDKVLHFAACLLITLLTALLIALVSGSSLGGALAGFIAAMGAGAGKELGDMISPVNRWDWWDILADLCGALIGSSVVFWIMN